jgi:transcriptional regulator with XRE-family HTH domain
MSSKTESTINERLKILMNALGANPSAFAKVLDLSDSTVRNYIYRDTKPGYEVLEKLYRSFRHINLEWLFGGTGEPLLTDLDKPAATHQRAKNFTGNNVGVNHGNAIQTQHAADAANCLQQLEAAKQLAEQLQSQLRDKERIIQLLEKSSK